MGTNFDRDKQILDYFFILIIINKHKIERLTFNQGKLQGKLSDRKKK